MKFIGQTIGLIALIGISINAEAQDNLPANVAPSWIVEPLVTDRPDQTESSVTVPHKSLQIETGIVFENFSTNNSTLQNWGLGSTLFRYGLLSNLELRLSSSYQLTQFEISEAGSDTVQQGLGPISTGIKVFIVEENGIWPEVSLLADITLNRFANLDYRPTYNYSTFKIAASHTLSDQLGLGYNLGYAYNGEDPKGFFVYSLVLGISLTNKLGAYIEGYGNFDPGAQPQHRLDGGLTYLVKHNLQLDLSGGFGPEQDEINMWFASLGFSWRIPE